MDGNMLANIFLVFFILAFVCMILGSVLFVLSSGMKGKIGNILLTLTPLCFAVSFSVCPISIGYPPSANNFIAFYAFSAMTIVCVLLTIYVPFRLCSFNRRATQLQQLRQSIIKTKYIDSDHTVTQETKVSTGSAIGRAIVGDFVAGPIGAIIGSATAKEKVTIHEKHTTTFMVYYSDGRRDYQTVENETELYKLYMEKLDLD